METYTFTTDDPNLAVEIIKLIGNFTQSEHRHEDLSGLTIRELRLKAGLTQKELAVASGIHSITISRVETGLAKPKDITLSKLENACLVAIRKRRFT